MYFRENKCWPLRFYIGLLRLYLLPADIATKAGSHPQLSKYKKCKATKKSTEKFSYRQTGNKSFIEIRFAQQW
jgi:hypothetical protein